MYFKTNFLADDIDVHRDCHMETGGKKSRNTGRLRKEHGSYYENKRKYKIVR